MATSTAIATSLFNIAPVRAQLFPQQRPTRSRQYEAPRRNPNVTSNTVPRGFVIPIEYEEEKILLTPEETVPVTLLVAANVRDSQRNTLIPYGSEIIGQVEPSEDESGSVFIASEIVFPDGTTRALDARSQIITRREMIKKGADAGDVVQGAAIGAAAAAVLSEIFGDIGALEVLGGAGAGALAGILLGGNEVELISIDPNKDLDLTLESNLTVR